MASYDLVIECYHRTHTLSVHPQMSRNHIVQNITSHFNLNEDSCDLKIYDERFKIYVDFDDEYAEDLRQRLPLTPKQTLLVQVLLPGISDTKADFDQSIDLLSSSMMPDKSPSGISVSEDLTPAVTDIDVHVWLPDRSSFPPNNAQQNLNEDSHTINHLIFARDVAPYQKEQHPTDTSHENKGEDSIKKRYVRRVQGSKTHCDSRYTSILPEIKIPSHFARLDGLRLVVAIVVQELKEDQVIWRFHKLKGFVADNAKTDTPPVNPLYLNIAESALTEDGIFKLPLRTCDSFQSRAEEKEDTIFHTLDLATVKCLHPAEHAADTPRLACVLADKNGAIQWQTFGLSDFIRPIVLTKRKTGTQNSDDQSSEEKEKSTTGTHTDPAAKPDNTIRRQRFVQNFVLIWLDSNINELYDDSLNSITHLRRIFNTINTFTDADECVDFLTDIKHEKAFMIVSGALGQQYVPYIQNVSQLDSIYVFCEQKFEHEQWAKEWSKVKGVFTEIGPICQLLKQDTLRCDRDSIPLSFVSATNTSNQNLDHLDQSFMYTQILKEILLEIDYDVQSIRDLAAYCREQYVDNHGELNMIAKFEREYHSRSPIWWYTSSYFLYSLLNRALRTQEIDTIIRMGSFIQDLHQNIKQLYSEQSSGYQTQPFTVYRGQGLSEADFCKLMENKGGLLSFNNFLSTSRDIETSFSFADSCQTNPDFIGIVFQMDIDPSDLSSPFAHLDHVSYHQDSEEEILFSMHTIFRIGNIKKIDDTNRLWHVELTLTSDNDQLLSALTEQIREETFLGSMQDKSLLRTDGWHRLGILLIKLAEFNKAEQLYRVVLDLTSDDVEKTFIYHQLGVIADAKGNYTEAISLYKKALQTAQTTLSPDHSWFATFYNSIGQVYYKLGEYSKALLLNLKALENYQKHLPLNHPSLATFYNNIGIVYYHTGEYLKALFFYGKGLEIHVKFLPSNHPFLGTSYNNIGLVYENMGEYLNALSFYEKTLDIYQKSLPPYHPSLATSYNNIGLLYKNMGHYSKALSFYEKVLEINEKSLSPNHPFSGTSYNNIGLVYDNMGEYSKALSFFEKALEIDRKSLPPNHPDLASSYVNISSVYDNLQDYSKALLFREKALEIYQKTLPSNHPSLATSYNNIGQVYHKMGEYSKALSLYEKALEIHMNSLPSNHPDVACSYNNIGLVYHQMGEYSKALSFYEKTLEIYQKSFPSSHPDLASSYVNIGSVYDNMREHEKALSYHKKALEIYQKTLPPNHLSLATSYNNIGLVHKNMGEYSAALSCHERALEIYQKTLPPNHPLLATSYNNTGQVYNNVGEYSQALSYYERALEIYQNTLSPSHLSLATSYNNIGVVYTRMGEYSKALLFYEKSLEIDQKTLPPNHPDLACSYNNIGLLYYQMGEYSKAISFTERAVDIGNRTLPTNHPELLRWRSCLELARRKCNE